MVSKTLNMVLLLVILMAGRSHSFAQGASVRDTTVSFYILSTCGGGGSVRDTCKFIAAVQTYTTNSASKMYYSPKKQVSYYRINCNSCSLLHWDSAIGGVEPSLPALSKVSDPTLIALLRKQLLKQIAQACNSIK